MNSESTKLISDDSLHGQPTPVCRNVLGCMCCTTVCVANDSMMGNEGHVPIHTAWKCPDPKGGLVREI